MIYQCPTVCITYRYLAMPRRLPLAVHTPRTFLFFFTSISYICCTFSLLLYFYLLANNTKWLTFFLRQWKQRYRVSEWDGDGTMMRGKACESRWCMCEITRKVPTVGHIRAASPFNLKLPRACPFRYYIYSYIYCVKSKIISITSTLHQRLYLLC